MNKEKHASGQAWIPAFAGMTGTGWAFLIPLVVLLLCAFYYYPFFVDDSYITLRYADRLLHGHGLTWNDGEKPVEGYSNFLLVILTAAFGGIGFDLVGAARLIGVLSSIAAMLALTYYHHRFLPGKILTLFIGNLTLALTGPVAIWSIGGLEGTLIMALLAWAWVLAVPLLEKPDSKAAAIVGVLLGFVCITRPEGAFFTAATVAALLLFAHYPRRRLLPPLAVLCAIPFAFFAAQVAFRLAYYGYWMPNTYYAKVTETSDRIVIGAMYVLKAEASFLALWIAIFLHFDRLVKDKRYARAKRAVYFFLALSVAWLTMVLIAGGDMEPGYRHVLPVVPLMVLILMECADIAYDSGAAYKSHLFFGYLLVVYCGMQFGFKENQDAKHEVWEHEASELGEWLDSRFHNTQPLIAVTNAGAIPYYSHLPTLDMYGINDAWLAHHPSKIFGHGFLGHELFQRDYVLARKPDIVILFTGFNKNVYASTLVGNPEFMREYKPVEFALPTYTPTLWMRRDSKKIGLQGE